MLWILFFWLYRDYRLDYFRQHLFALRDELFDLAKNEEISFTDDAYKLTRAMLNGTIRFGHKLGFVDMVCLVLSTRGAARKGKRGDCFESRVKNAYAEVSPEVQEKLGSIRFRMHMLMLEQIVFTSSILMFSLFTFAFAVVSFIASRRLARFFGKAFLRPRFGYLLSLNDYAACVYGGGIRGNGRQLDVNPRAFAGG
ncbi:hypothetical protein RMSM_01536 [Rhodopirellula maiorica SM1]|uniref:Uncharacterized protein n=2 Tax=Novipirellula TaxID=2795426 RepID=M5RQP5_9BACT|nr:hypothetical protein RMSM_01536 [Rhodopirellula maiorica SM1]